MELILTTAITSSTLIISLFTFQQIYGCLYDLSTVPIVARGTQEILTSLLHLSVGVSMMITPPIDFIIRIWPGLIYPIYLFDLGDILSNRRLYKKTELIALASGRIIRILTVTIFLIIQTPRLTSWYLLWNFTSIPFSVHGIWLYNHRNMLDPPSYYKIYIHHILTMVLQNTCRLGVYPLLFVFNTEGLIPAAIGFGFMIGLHLFELYVEVRDALEIYSKRTEETDN